MRPRGHHGGGPAEVGSSTPPLVFRREPAAAHLPSSPHQVHRHHPAFEREIRPRLQFGGETARGADGAAAGGAVAQRDPPNLPSRFTAGEVRPSRAEPA